MAISSLHPQFAQQNPPSLLEWEQARDGAEELFQIIALAASSGLLSDNAQCGLRAILRLAQSHMNDLNDLFERQNEHEQLTRELDRTAPRAG